MNWPTFLSMTLLPLLVGAFFSVHGTMYETCDQSLGNSTRECLQQCSNSAGCPGNYQCLVPSLCSQKCYDGTCYCNTHNCTQACSTSYCKNTAMTCHSQHCKQTCSGDCNLECTRNASGVCQQDCSGTCKNTFCDQKRCLQKTYCRNPPCTLQCSSNVDDCQQTCSYGKCNFLCNARQCKSKCNSGICTYEGNPQVNTNNECDKIDTLSKQCFQEGCGWPNCSLNCANAIPGLLTGCSQSCMEPMSLCPTSMSCSYGDCMQNCFGKCQKIVCDRQSERCGQLCEGRCDVLQCNATTHCLQHCSGDCNTIECSSAACLQSCKSKNCTMKCDENVANCSQSCTTEGPKTSCILESKALHVEHQSCNKNCTAMTCGQNSANCTQKCGEGCTKMVCSSAFCITGNCTLNCSAQYCENCTSSECLPSPTTTGTFSPTTKTTITTTRTPTTHPTEPTTAEGCGGETSAQRKIENLIKTKMNDDNLVMLLCIAIGIMTILLLVVLVGFICVLSLRLRGRAS